MKQIIHFETQEERLKYLKGNFEEIIPQKVEEKAEEKVEKPKRKRKKKDEVQAE